MKRLLIKNEIKMFFMRSLNNNNLPINTPIRAIYKQFSFLNSFPRTTKKKTPSESAIIKKISRRLLRQLCLNCRAKPFHAIKQLLPLNCVLTSAHPLNIYILPPPLMNSHLRLLSNHPINHPSNLLHSKLVQFD